ncbi:MAG: host nuclease inhibitor protein [Cyanobacteria bacterium J06631_2]
MIYASCDRRGVIEFGEKVPEGNLPLHYGEEAQVKERISVVARHAYDNKTLLVPGVPEADNDDEAVDKLSAWIKHFKLQPDSQSLSMQNEG